MSTGERGARGGRLRVLVLVAMTLANAMVLVDQTAVPLILPSIIHEFGVSSVEAQWVLTASLLVLAGFLVFGGRLGDLLGLRKVFIAGSVLFALASACAGLSPSFGVLLVFRVVQGLGGALMLPTTIALVSAGYTGAERGSALGIMGGAAAVAGAMGPVIGGSLTSLFGWRSVLLVNVPLAAIAVVATVVGVPRDARRSGGRHLDFVGTGLLSVSLITLVFGLSQSEVWGFGSPGVLVPLALSVVAAPVFVVTELRSPDPLLDVRLLLRHHDYLGATVSQSIAGIAEMGLGLLFPLVLILMLGMPPALAGLALLPATLPMIVVSPLAGRWYDRVGGRRPLASGFALLGLSGILLAVGVQLAIRNEVRQYWFLFPGFLLYGVGLALILTVNDPVSLDSMDARHEGQASGVSATAEQFGGAVGIALLYLIFHAVYLRVLLHLVSNGPLHGLTPAKGAKLKAAITAAEQTGLNPSTFPPDLRAYLNDAATGSAWGMSAAFVTVTLLSALAFWVMLRLVRGHGAPVRADGPPPAWARPARVGTRVATTGGARARGGAGSKP